MKRSIALVSVATTAFSLVILASVVYGYRVSASSRSARPAASEPQQTAAMVSTGSVRGPSVSPQEAAAIAAKFLDRTDPYSVQLAEFDKEQSYEVTFSSGDVVYVSLEGVVLGSVPGPVQVAYSRAGEKEPEGRGGGQGDAAETGEHESDDKSEHDDEHESEHDDEAGD